MRGAVEALALRTHLKQLRLWTLWTLMTLLALPGGVRAGSPCSGKPPRILATTSNNPTFETRLIVTRYGDDVTLACTGDGANLRIRNATNDLQVDNLYSATVQLTISKPHVGRNEYYCTDIKTNCEDIMEISTYPALSLTSLQAREVTNNGERQYFVPMGEQHEIFCSAHDITALQSINLLFNGPLPTKVVNESTIKYSTKANTYFYNQYSCFSRNGLSDKISVLVDYHPMAINFQCSITYKNFWPDNLECFWYYASASNIFHLYNVDEFGVTRLLCDITPARNTVRLCTSNVYKCTSLIMQTCNRIICENQTIPLDCDSITKLGAPLDLKLLAAQSNYVIITGQAWRSYRCSDRMFKIEYKLLGAEWRTANSSLVQCENVRCDCQFRLNLECPDSHYELRVYVKLKQARDRFWSEPATMYFFTAASSTNKVLDPRCNEELEEKEPPPSIDVMMYKVRRLIRYERNAISQLKKKVKSLKEQLVTVKALTKH